MGTSSCRSSSTFSWPRVPADSAHSRLRAFSDNLSLFPKKHISAPEGTLPSRQSSSKTSGGQLLSVTAVRDSSVWADKGPCKCACFPMVFTRCRRVGARLSPRERRTPEGLCLPLPSPGSPPFGPLRSCWSYLTTTADSASPSYIFCSVPNSHGSLAKLAATTSSSAYFTRCHWRTSALCSRTLPADVLSAVKRYGGAAKYDRADLGGKRPGLARDSLECGLCGPAPSASPVRA